jgi:hypothetical protein
MLPEGVVLVESVEREQVVQQVVPELELQEIQDLVAVVVEEAREMVPAHQTELLDPQEMVVHQWELVGTAVLQLDQVPLRVQMVDPVMQEIQEVLELRIREVLEDLEILDLLALLERLLLL